MVDQDTQNKSYDAIAPYYASYAKTKETYINAINQLVLSYLKPNMRLLDIGSGDGLRLKNLLRESNIDNAVAIEPSHEMAELCRKNLNIQVFEKTAIELAGMEMESFDVVTALWNVFGHIPGTHDRKKSLQAIYNKLNSGGVVVLDVNNRHNQRAYGRLKVMYRRLLDYWCFSEKRGDAQYFWNIDGQKIAGSGHLFIPQEVEKLFLHTGFQRVSRFTVDYLTGEVSNKKFQGQLFYVFKKI